MKQFLEKINLVAKYKKLPFDKKKKYAAYFFIMPWLIGILFFFIPPVADTIYTSFFTFTIDRQSGMTWAGLENFKTLLNPVESLLMIAVNSFVEVLYTIPIAVIFSLFIAIILNSKFRGRAIVRTIFFLPLIMGLNVVKLVMENNAMNSIVDNEVSTSGASLGFLSVNRVVSFIYETGIPRTLLDPIVSSINSIFTVISFTGVQILLFLAALQSVNKSLYEAAEIEGCNKYESFWKITLPMVLPSMRVVVVYTIIDAVARSEIVSYISSAMMSRYSQGVKSATSLTIIAISLLLILVCLAIIPKGGYERDKL